MKTDLNTHNLIDELKNKLILKDVNGSTLHKIIQNVNQDGVYPTLS